MKKHGGVQWHERESIWVNILVVYALRAHMGMDQQVRFETIFCIHNLLFFYLRYVNLFFYLPILSLLGLSFSLFHFFMLNIYLFWSQNLVFPFLLILFFFFTLNKYIFLVTKHIHFLCEEHKKLFEILVGLTVVSIILTLEVCLVCPIDLKGNYLYISRLFYFSRSQGVFLNILVSRVHHVPMSKNIT